MFEAEQDTDDPDSAYLLIQRQFEDPDGNWCYIETPGLQQLLVGLSPCGPRRCLSRALRRARRGAFGTGLAVTRPPVTSSRGCSGTCVLRDAAGPQATIRPTAEVMGTKEQRRVWTRRFPDAALRTGLGPLGDANQSGSYARTVSETSGGLITSPSPRTLPGPAAPFSAPFVPVSAGFSARLSGRFVKFSALLGPSAINTPLALD